MVKTIILAGGKSSRFKTNKMSALLDGQPILFRTIKPFLKVTDSVTVVTGFFDVNYLKEYIDLNKLNIVHNELHELGMFSSILKGVQNINTDIFLTPGDYPNIKQDTLKKILDEDGDIRVPRYKGRKGHPIYLTKKVVEELKKESIESNLKIFRDRHLVNYIDVDDEGILQDIDIYEDLEKMKARNKS